MGPGVAAALLTVWGVTAGSLFFAGAMPPSMADTKGARPSAVLPAASLSRAAPAATPGDTDPDRPPGMPSAPDADTGSDTDTGPVDPASPAPDIPETDTPETDTPEAETPDTGTSGIADAAATVWEGDAERGEQLARPCFVCHTAWPGAGNAIGPNLYGVVGRPVASLRYFHYSERLMRRGGLWTPARLDAFIAERKAFDQGSHMAFLPFQRNARDRRDLIAWLTTLRRPSGGPRPVLRDNPPPE
ncbi:cytochrome c2 [Eilatimonas milleporae]|uniref:Cytochrome c2 n=2 Tax=Eilatimonas milleporae TaxID=911205 RepID=A0A3M0CDP8_9PROT|nr:cytochrome c2 [Eilatimonas milleporae]